MQGNLLSFWAERTDPQLEISLISHDGIGTSDVPLRVSAILRHADMADESTSEEAYERALRISNDMHQALCETLWNESSSVIELKDLLTTISRNAQADTYYSAAVAILSTKRFVAAGIGNVGIWRCSEKVSGSLIKPSIIRFPARSGKLSILSGALGIGFAPEKIQTCDVSLESGYAVLALQPADLDDQPLPKIEYIHSSNEALQDIVGRLQRKPALLAVIGPVES
jgi:hypothetical protein